MLGGRCILYQRKNMKEKKFLIRKDGHCFALVRDCSSFWSTGIGLIGSREPALQDGLYSGVLFHIPGYRRKCTGFINSIHMIGMMYPISVFWLNGNTVVDKAYAVPGLHIYSPAHPATHVLELNKEALHEVNIGEVLSIGRIL